MSLWKYIKSAFTNQWNLLALFGGLGFAAISGRPDIVAPVVLAAECGYLGLIGTHPKFQRYVDAQEHKAARGGESESAERSLRRIMNSLPRESLQKYEALQDRCEKLHGIAGDLKRSRGTEEIAGMEDMRTSSLDRLLWLYLKLLFTEHSLGRFFQATREENIVEETQQVEERLKQEQERAEPRSRVVATLEDNLATCRERLNNFRKAKDNYEFVQLEIGRLENKIRSLSEVAVNRHDPEYISDQVGQVTDSVAETERTMNDLQFLTGLRTDDDEVPELMHRQSEHIRH